MARRIVSPQSSLDKSAPFWKGSTAEVVLAARLRERERVAAERAAKRGAKRSKSPTDERRRQRRRIRRLIRAGLTPRAAEKMVLGR